MRILRAATGKELKAFEHEAHRYDLAALQQLGKN
jgi:hypothetical protein